MKRALRRRFVWLCVAVAVVAFAVGVAGSVRSRGLETHEIFVAQTARQMLAAAGGKGDWVRPVFNDKARLNKPPLMYWLVMGGAKVLPGGEGVPPWVARLPSAFASVVMALGTVALGALLVNRSVGLLAGVIGVGSIGWIGYANNARPEMVYGALSVVMVGCFAWVWRKGVQSQSSKFKVQSSDGDGKEGLLVALSGWLAGGLAILAKGPQVPVVLMLGFAAFAAAEGKTRGLWKLRPLVGVPLMLLVPVPWVVAVLMREPGGWQAWTRDLFEGRAGAGDPGVKVVDYLKPYYLYAIPGLLLPWAVLLPWGIARAVKKGRPERWGLRLCVWLLAVPAVVMSMTLHRRDYYLLALMPVMAVLVAAAVWGWVASRPAAGADLRGAGDRRHGGLVALLMVVAVVGGGLAASPVGWGDRRELMNAFAEEAWAAATREIGVGARIACHRSDPAFLVYARNGPVPEVDDPTALAERLRAGELDAVLCSPKSWERLAKTQGPLPAVRVIAESKGRRGHEDEAMVLLKVEQ